MVVNFRRSVITAELWWPEVVRSFIRSLLRAGVQPTLDPSAETFMSVQCASSGRGGELVGVCGVCASCVGWRKGRVGVKSQDIENLHFGEKWPIGINFQNSVSKVFIATLIDVLCSNFMKFGRLEIDEIMHCLPDKKICLALQLSLLLLHRSCPKSANSVVSALQISSNLLHCWWSCSQSCEHCQNAL